MKRLLAIPAVLLALAAFIVFAGPFLLPQSVLHDRIAPPLERQAGIALHELKRIRLTFSPEFGVAIEGVKAGLAKGGRGERTFEAERIVASIEPSSLLEGRIALRRIRLESPLLVIGGDLTLLGAGPQHGGYGARLIPAALSQSMERFGLPLIDVDVTGGGAVLRSGEDETLAAVSNATLSLRHDAADGRVSLDGDFDLEGQKFRLGAAAAPPSRDAPGQVMLAANLRSAALDLKIEGMLIEAETPLFSGPLSLRVLSATELGRWLGGDAASYARFEGASLNGELDISDEALALSGARIEAPDFQSGFMLTASFGRMLEARLTDARIFGGDAAGAFALTRGEGESRMSASFAMNGVDAHALGRGLTGFDWVSGRAEARLELSGAGRSFSGILEDLEGAADLTVTDGAIEGVDLPRIVAEARDGKFSNWERKPDLRTPFETMQATYRIEDGVAETKDLRVTGPGLLVTGAGRTNFADRQLRYRLQTRISAVEAEQDQDDEGEQVRFSVPLTVKGDWARPEIAPDFNRMLKDPESLSGTLDLIGRSIERLTRGKPKAEAPVLEEDDTDDIEERQDADGRN